MPKGRPRLPYFRVDYKVSLPAKLAADIDYLFFDPATNKPRYGARARLIEALLRFWLARERNQPLPALPSLDELRA